MSVKILLLCAQAVLIQSVASQCIGRPGIDAAAAYGWAEPGLAPALYDGYGPYAYEGYAGPFGYDGYVEPLGYEGYAAPFGYDGCAGPYGYDAYAGPFGYDGYAGSFGCDRYAGSFGYDGYAGPFRYDGYTAPFGYGGLGWRGFPVMDFKPTSGGSFVVTSSSPIRPTGLSIVSENYYEGPLSVVGEMPFLAVVSLDGVLPTLGSGAINHACGNGVSAIYNDLAATPYGAYEPYGLGYPAPGIGYGVGGCGCGVLY